MKILTAIIKTLLGMIFVGFVALLVILILAIIMPENMQKAFEFIKSIM